MTATVCDMTYNILTADTRWSCGGRGELVLSDHKKYMIFCDDTGFDKICVVKNTALVVAGSGPLIAKWKEWWSGDADPDKRPPVKESGEFAIVLSIVDLENSVTLFDKGPKTVLYCQYSEEIKAYSFGSGAPHAASSLLLDECAKNAVISASKKDLFTSDIVKYVCYKTHQDNLSEPTNDYNAIVSGIVERGYMMELNPNNRKNVIKISDHPLGKEVVGKFESGDAIASAPVPGITSKTWTDSDEVNFIEAMNRVRELRNN